MDQKVTFFLQNEGSSKVMCDMSYESNALNCR